MRGAVIAVLILTLISMPLIIESSDADGVVELYFFDKDGVCVAQVYLLPDEPLKAADVPPHSSGNWYAEDGTYVHAGVKFSSGVHTIVEATSWSTHTGPRPLIPPLVSTDVLALIIAVIDLVGIGYLILRRK
jgi:hypothetical protein